MRTTLAHEECIRYAAMAIQSMAAIKGLVFVPVKDTTASPTTPDMIATSPFKVVIVPNIEVMVKELLSKPLAA